MNKDYDVVGIGASTIDVLNIVDHFPGGEEVQRSIGSVIQGGGPIATAIVTLARLGIKTAMLDSIGGDLHGKRILEEFKNENVNTDFIKISRDCISSSAVILVRSHDGLRTIVFSPGGAPEVSASDIQPELISGTKFIHMNGRYLKACLHACKIAKETGTKISFDGGSHRFREELKKLIPFVDICIAAEDFAINYSGQKNIYEAAKIILQSGPEVLIITDGLNGSFLFTKEINGYRQEAFTVEDTIDTTGCGDSYHGAVLFGLCKGYNLFDSMKIASAVAAINSTRLGGRAALPTFEKVENFLRQRNCQL